MNLWNSFLVILILGCLSLPITSAHSEPIYHEVHYPAGAGPFPAVIALHTSGGFKTVQHLIKRYVDDGFVVFAPDFFSRYKITPKTRMETFGTFREPIERDLTEIVGLAKSNPKVDTNNLFAVGFSNGGFWVCFLTGKSLVNAGVSHYGVWKANFGSSISNPYPMEYFSKSSAPILALHGDSDKTQRMKFVSQAWDRARSNGANLTTHIYAGADHAWDRQGSKKYSYNKEVDKDAHSRTIEFFKKNMK